MKRYAVVLAALVAIAAGSWTVVAFATPAQTAAPAAAHGHAGAEHATSADAASAHVSSTGEPSAQEVMFVTMMLDHHQQALDMGEIIAQTPDVPPRVANLAASIQVSQTSEIGTSKSWLAAWEAAGAASGGHSGHGTGAAAAHMTMRGMIGPEGFAELDAAEGIEAARVYLRLMIEHHEGAIESASDIFPTLSNPWVISFARHIVNEQTVEIAGMRRILESL